MQIGNYEVKSKSNLLGIATCPIFDTLEEALTDSTHGLGEAKILELLNAQIRTNAMNTLRTAKTKGPTKGWLKDEATAEVVASIQDHPELIGDTPALQAAIAKKMDEISERMKANAEAESTEDDGDEDDN